jgi:hypothetical protein
MPIRRREKPASSLNEAEKESEIDFIPQQVNYDFNLNNDNFADMNNSASSLKCIISNESRPSSKSSQAGSSKCNNVKPSKSELERQLLVESLELKFEQLEVRRQIIEPQRKSLNNQDDSDGDIDSLLDDQTSQKNDAYPPVNDLIILGPVDGGKKSDTSVNCLTTQFSVFAHTTNISDSDLKNAVDEEVTILPACKFILENNTCNKKVPDSLITREYLDSKEPVWQRKRIKLTALKFWQSKVDYWINPFADSGTNLVDDLKDIVQKINHKDVLTPNHLLQQKYNTQSIDYVNLRDRCTRGCRQGQLLSDTFWRHWKIEYLTTLRVRHNWSQTRIFLKVGDVVFLIEDKTTHGTWPKRVTKDVSTERVGHVQKVMMKTTRNIRQRDIRKVCRLDRIHER